LGEKVWLHLGGEQSIMKQQARAAMAVYERIAVASERLTADEQAALKDWEKAHVTGDGKFATTDWPGWSAVLRRVFH
jgi:hypothetical protein